MLSNAQGFILFGCRICDLGINRVNKYHEGPTNVWTY